MTPILRTERLTLREFDHDDLHDLAAMVADEEQMRFYPRPKTRDEASAWITRNLGLYRERGFGVWRVDDRATSAFAGYCGFRPLLLAGAWETEMVWHIEKTFWMRGIATEAATTAGDAAVRRFGIPRLVAVIHPDNVPSRRVAQNIGMRVESATTFEEEPAVIYARAAPG
jgi:RimJ/RimL family protein N-acetyltransferase